MSLKDCDYMPQRVAIVTRDLAEFDLRGHMARIAELAESHRCDTVVHALWTEHRQAGARWVPPLNHYFGNTRVFPRYILHETGNLEDSAAESDVESDLLLEVWARDSKQPIKRVKIAFAKSAAHPEKKKQFVESFNRERLISKKCGFIYCGEFNIIGTQRSSSKIRDEHNFMEKIKATRFLAVPTHRRPRRYEIKKKLQAMSVGRTVVTTWAIWSGHGRAKVPWQAFHHGRDVTDAIIEVPNTIRPDVRVGVLDLASLR